MDIAGYRDTHLEIIDIDFVHDLKKGFSWLVATRELPAGVQDDHSV